MWVFDLLDPGMLWANAAAVHLWTAPTLESLCARDFSSDMSPSARARLGDYLTRFEKGERVTETWTFYPEDRGTVTVDCTCRGVCLEDRRAMLVEARDKAAVDDETIRGQEALRHVTMLIGLFDPRDGRALYENPASLARFGADTPKLDDRFVDRAEGRALLGRVFAGRRVRCEAKMRTRLGPRLYELDAHLSRDPVTSRSAIVVAGRDIWELDEARRARARAEAESLSKARFLERLGHEIRTPLNGVLGLGTLLLDARLEPDGRELVESLNSSAHALVAVVDDVLDYAQLDSGRFRLLPQPLDLLDLVEGVVDVSRFALAARDVDLALRLAPSCPRHVVVDHARLRQILLAFVGNAIKFTTHGEILIEVQGRRAGDEARLRFSVTDTGPGIAPEDLERIFDEFVQLDTSSARQFEGAGLGLTIARHSAALLGAQITAESEPGRGSTFHLDVRLPTCRAAIQQADALEGELVVVELDPTQRAIWEELFEHTPALGGLVTDSAEAALDHLRGLRPSTNPPVVLSTARLPAEDRRALAKAVHEDPALFGVGLLHEVAGLRQRGTEAADARVLRAGGVRRIARAIEEARRGALRRSSTLDLPAGPIEAPTPTRDLVVLVVDDNQINRRVARQMLARIGCHVDEACDGEEAVQMVRTKPFDIVFMDCEMPTLDGFEATRLIRHLDNGASSVPIVALTAYVQPKDRLRCLDAGMNDHLAKPVTPEALQRTLSLWANERGADEPH